jgi:hypothetical protein
MDGKSVDRTRRGLVPGSGNRRFMTVGFNAPSRDMFPNPSDNNNQTIENR